jgi:hypothetical protein
MIIVTMLFSNLVRWVISTISAAYVSWMMLFHRDKNILVIATKFSTASNLVKKVKAMIKLLPPWFDQLADNCHRQQIIICFEQWFRN